MPTNRTTSHLGQPAANSFDITPDDGAELDEYTRGIYVGVSGNVALLLMEDSGDTARVVYLAAGVCHPLAVRKVFNTGTDATDIVGVY